MKQFEQKELPNNEYLNAGDFLYELGQAQYVLRPLTNIFPDEYPNLGDGLRYQGTYGNYHDIKIHKDDILEYAKRYIEWKNKSATPFGKLNEKEILEKINKELK